MSNSPSIAHQRRGWFAPLRLALLLSHRYGGLTAAVFLFVVGITGSVLAFNWELERVFAPQLFAAPRPASQRLDLATLAVDAEKIVPQGRAEYICYTQPDQVMVNFLPRVNPATGHPYDLGFDEFFMDPWTGKELGRRNSGDLSEGMINFIPFLYRIHWTLAAGDVGQWIIGLVALFWSVDLFVAFCLTLPRGAGGFWRRWKYAWQVKWKASAVRVNFDLHRAGGLWVWPLLFVFAWSGVMMNIRPVYERVMRTVFDYQQPTWDSPERAHPNETPRLAWQEAQSIGQRLMAEQGAQKGFTAGEPLSMAYIPELGVYYYDVRGSRDLFDRAPKGGSTSLTFDGNTGALVDLSQPTGEHAGNTAESWLYALHMARVFGRPYQVFVCLLGLLIAMLSATGVYLWWKRFTVRRGRNLQAA